ncbi:MAG: adenosylcobyric acid synthase, partial [Micromonosporaceae bacterium]|nr:adenosylcobyric acid synthase [Micromonosporaceae bacterium]
NMSNNSAVVVDEVAGGPASSRGIGPYRSNRLPGETGRGGETGRAGEIGRAQAMQAAACGLAPSVRFNPVLLKPGSDRTSQVVLLGRPIGQVAAATYREYRDRLRSTVLDTLAELRAEFDVVVCEGAGSPAEINLRVGDFVNMGLARAANLPTIVVGDIDRGGVFAALYGTLALLSAEDQALLSGYVVNKFRGDAGLLQPGLDELLRLTGRPVYGVLPWQPDLWLDAEDSLAYGSVLGRPTGPVGTEWLRVAVARLPRISNITDAEAFAAEPGVRVRITTEPAELADADLIVLPGSKSTVDDLRWLRETGLAEVVLAHAAAGKPVLGICGGYQMLADRIHDDVESRRGTVAGLGLLPIEIAFAAEKTLARPSGTGLGVSVSGYEIHHGYVSSGQVPPLIRRVDGAGEGAECGNIFGTHWHGAFESDGFRRAFLSAAAGLAGRHGFTVAAATDFAALRERGLDLLGDLIEEHLDTEALWRLIESGPVPGLPVIGPAAR